MESFSIATNKANHFHKFMRFLRLFVLCQVCTKKGLFSFSKLLQLSIKVRGVCEILRDNEDTKSTQSHVLNFASDENEVAAPMKTSAFFLWISTSFGRCFPKENCWVSILILNEVGFTSALQCIKFLTVLLSHLHMFVQVSRCQVCLTYA